MRRSRPTTVSIINFMILVHLQVTSAAAQNFTRLHEVVEGRIAAYDNQIRPQLDDGVPVVNNIDMFINSIGSVKEMDMTYTIDIYLRQRWKEPRLAYKSLTSNNNSITLRYSQLSRLWVPDLFIVNELKAVFHDITTPNRLIRLSPEGDILYSQRLQLTLFCYLMLEKYPFDNQTCSIKFMSYGYTAEDIIFRWRPIPEPIQRDSNLALPEFTITKLETGDCTETFNTGTFTCIYGNILLKRRLEYYLIQMYVPSALVVMLSWVSFWIDKQAVPARITLGLLTVLTLTTQTAGSNQNLPRVSYIKAMDVWHSTCLVFVFGALIEYSVVNVIDRKRKKPESEADSSRDAVVRWYRSRDKLGSITEKTNTSQESSFTEGQSETNLVHRQHSVSESTDNNSAFCLPTTPGQEGGKGVGWNCKPCLRKWFTRRATSLDLLSRLGFPIAFVVFNAVYWIYYFVLV